MADSAVIKNRPLTSLRQLESRRGANRSAYLERRAIVIAQTTDIYFIAQNAGLFTPRCADHDWVSLFSSGSLFVSSRNNRAASEIKSAGGLFEAGQETVSW